MICNTTFEVVQFHLNCSNLRIAILIGCIIAALIMIFIVRNSSEARNG